MDDNYNLERFVEAQRNDYATALSEVKQGRKQSHWMWYIFPQVMGLGYTSTSIHFSIKDLNEAKAYLEHPVLGKRLTEISTALLSLETNDAYKVFGNPDTAKLKSSMTLFSLVPGADNIFQKILDKFFNGKRDEKTLQLLGV